MNVDTHKLALYNLSPYILPNKFLATFSMYDNTTPPSTILDNSALYKLFNAAHKPSRNFVCLFDHFADILANNSNNITHIVKHKYFIASALLL